MTEMQHKLDKLEFLVMRAHKRIEDKDNRAHDIQQVKSHMGDDEGTKK